MKKNLYCIVLFCLPLTVLAGFSACKKKKVETKCDPFIFNIGFVGQNQMEHVGLVAYQKDETFSAAIDSFKDIQLIPTATGGYFDVKNATNREQYACDWKVTTYPSGRSFRIKNIYLSDNKVHHALASACVGDNASVIYSQDDSFYQTPGNGGSKFLTLDIHY